MAAAGSAPDATYRAVLYKTRLPSACGISSMLPSAEVTPYSCAGHTQVRRHAHMHGVQHARQCWVQAWFMVLPASRTPCPPPMYGLGGDEVNRMLPTEFSTAR